MKLGPANKELFGETPRYAGLVGPERDNQTQFLIFDRSNMEMFLDSNYGECNMYSRISHIGDEGGSILDEVFFDFDIEKPDEENWAAKIIPEMRRDRLVADNVLGDVVEDVRQVSRYLEAREWPAIGVFSGLGVHVHALTQACVQPDTALRTTVRKVEAEAGLETLDEKGARQGDYNRLCRIANCPRIASSGERVGLYTIPLTREEMMDITAEELLKWSVEPRQVQVPREEKPKLQIVEEYETQTDSGVVDVDVREVGDVANDALEDQFEVFLKDVIKMPCMYERIMSRNPDNDVRLNCAVLLFNCGLTVKDVKEIYRKLGWFDYDPEITESKLEHIWEKGYRSMSCQSIQEKGLCVYNRDERESCPTFGWDGGDKYY
jgi:hypothetical protein